MNKIGIIFGLHLYNGDSLGLYQLWDKSTVIMADGPYGVNGFRGDLKTPVGLAEWYEPHIAEWSKKATPQTTLWFWNTEIGWAIVHPILEKYGWEYKTCNVWDKGMSHVAGNTNTKILSHLPVVSEVCVQYVKKASFDWNGEKVSMKDWLRLEWERTGMPFSKTNEVCHVVNAATRKYFTKCHLWYMPPADMFEKIVAYANEHGKEEGKPYFSENKMFAFVSILGSMRRSRFFYLFTSFFYKKRIRCTYMMICASDSLGGVWCVVISSEQAHK